MRRAVHYVLAALSVLPLHPLSLGASPAKDTDAVQAAQIAQKLAAAQISLDNLEEPVRGRVAQLLQQPAVYTRGQTRAFPTRPFVYHWLLENPHLAARAWQGLGAKCAAIEKKAEGVFTGTDPAGGTVRWQKVCEQPGWRAWHPASDRGPVPVGGQDDRLARASQLRRRGPVREEDPRAGGLVLLRHGLVPVRQSRLSQETAYRNGPGAARRNPAAGSRSERV